MKNNTTERTKLNTEINQRKIDIDRSVFVKSIEEKQKLKEAKAQYGKIHNKS